MKKAILIIIVIGIVAGLYFTGMIFDSASYLEVEPDSLVFGKSGGEQRLLVKTDAKRWTIDKCPVWANAEKDGDSLVFDCGYMSSKMTMHDSLYIKAGDKRLAVPVKQYGKATYLRFVPDTLTFAQAGGKATARLETDGEKINGLFDSNVDAKIENGIVTIELGPNNNPSELFSYMLIHSDQIEGKLYYRQAGTGKRDVKIVTIKRCPTCGGTGKVVSLIDMASHKKEYEKCSACNGTGRMN